MASAIFRKCNICGEMLSETRIFKITPAPGKEPFRIEVGKCRVCDSRKCQYCGNYTPDPHKQSCVHCKKSFKVSKGEAK
jgi:hypothetical protein